MNTKSGGRGPQRNRETYAKRSRSPVGLSAPRLRFVNEFMKDRNCRQAAIRAGYSAAYARGRSWLLLKIPEVKAEIDRRAAQATAKADTDVVEILRDLKRIAFFDIRQLFRDGRIVTDPTLLDEDVARGLIDFEVIVLDKTGNYIVKLNPSGRMRALELLMKVSGMLTDRVESEVRTVIFSEDFGDADVSTPASAEVN